MKLSTRIERNLKTTLGWLITLGIVVFVALGVYYALTQL